MKNVLLYLVALVAGIVCGLVDCARGDSIHLGDFSGAGSLSPELTEVYWAEYTITPSETISLSGLPFSVTMGETSTSIDGVAYPAGWSSGNYYLLWINNGVFANARLDLLTYFGTMTLANRTVAVNYNLQPSIDGNATGSYRVYSFADNQIPEGPTGPLLLLGLMLYVAIKREV